MTATSANSEKHAVLLLAHGSPERLEDIPDFLRNVSGGRSISQFAVEEVKRRYMQVGRSPLTEMTMNQARALARELGVPVYVGMRNWRPYIADVVQQMSADGVTQAVIICLAPQNSCTSVGLYRKAVMGETGTPFDIDFVESWHDHPLLVRAFAEKLSAGWKRACAQAGVEIPVIFTAHSVPQRAVAHGDAYERQAKETAALVAQAVQLRPENWLFAFQSQGMLGGPWLGPTVEEIILHLKAHSERGVFIQPIGFVCDHVEILYDIDVACKQFAAQQGMDLWRAESLNDSATFIATLAELARSRMRPQQQAATSQENSLFPSKRNSR